MINNLPNFQRARVLILGDLILDRYWRGAAERVSPEAPVPIIKVDTIEELPGGAGNVALNVAALGAQTILMTCVGKDEAGERLKRLLEDANIECHFHEFDSIPTITKLRILSQNQQLLRADFERYLYDTVLTPAFEKKYRRLLANADALILSDYGKGMLKRAPELIKIAREYNIPICADPKNQDFTHYTGATLVTPNMKEFQAAVGLCVSETDIESNARQVLSKCDIDALLITRSEKGMTLIQKNQPALDIKTHAREVFDVTGAGDTVIATVASALAVNQPIEQATTLANIAAGRVVSKLGAATISPPELRRALHRYYDSSAGIVDFNQLIMLREDARAHGEKVVITNGCFDLLHAGHIRYLQEAKNLGDWLIVAVNDDASIERLKGEKRPIVPLKQRMAVLAALGCVDYVVPFSEDTPQRLIEQLKPDILVKGEDYTADQIAGAKSVIDYGGLVKTLALEPHCSTSNIIEKIKTGA